MKFKHLLLTLLLAALLPWAAMAQTSTLYTSYTATDGVYNIQTEAYPNLVDNNINTKWCVSNLSGPNNLGLYIEFQSAEPIIPTGYVLTTANDNATWIGRNPKDWTIKAKANPNDAWTTIATVTNDQVLQDVNFTDFEFTADNPNQVSYQYFRFDVTAIQSGTVFQLAELRFMVVDPLSELLYFTDFESQCDWTLVNGSCTNKWCWGTAAHNGTGTHGLYISNNGGTTNAYNNTSNTMVYAYKTFNFEADDYSFSYDWLANGESNWDFLRVALVPASVNLAAGTAMPSGFDYNALPAGWIALDGGSKLNMATDWQTASYEAKVPTAGEYKMVFAWCNDQGLGTNPPAAIDNVFIDVAACSTPVNLTVSNLTATTADLSWSASMPTDSYTVNYRKAESLDAIFTEGFEDGLGDWTLRDHTINSGISSDGAHSGSAGFRFHYNINPPQYLISPELTGVGDWAKLEFYYKNQSSQYPETFQVGYSTTDNETYSFIFGDEITASDAQWHLYSETIPAGTKYICWKYNSYNQYYLFIDDVFVGTKLWQTATVAGGANEVSTTLTGLTPATLYEAFVYPDCNPDKVSQTINFTTQESCLAPTNLTAGNIDPYTADLSWTGLPEVESYTVTYKPVPILYEDFENFAGFGDGEDDWTNSNHCVFVGGNSLVQGLPGSMKCCVLGCEISFLISPELPTDGLTLEFYYKIRNSDYPVIFQVGFSSTDKDIASFTFGDEIPYGDSEWHLHTTGVPTGTKYICWKTSNTMYIDDIMVYPDGYDTASEWQTQSVAGNAYQVGATLTGLAPANLYEAYVYPDCNPDKESDRLHFMTEDPCASPGNFTVGNVGTTTADLSWTGSPYTESFTVQYRTLPFFSEGFENGIGDWTLTDCHEYSCVTSSLGGHLSQQLFRFYFDSNQSGQQPQYLISPELTGLVQGMKLEFYYRRIVEGEGTDAFQVGFSTTDNQPESFTFDDEIDVFDYSWHLYSKRIPAGTKYICWKYNPSNDNAIHHVLIDDIVIGMETPVGRWQTATVAGNAAEVSTTLTGLTSSSPYEAYVYPDCNPDKISQPVYFTTEEDPCYLPFNLTVNNITYTTANLSWTAATEVDSYTLKYRVNDTLFFEGFENGIGDWTMFNYASNTGISHGAHSGFVGFLFYHDNNPPQYLISPELTGVGEGIRLEFYYRYWGYMETFQVGFSATDNATESFTFGDTITVSDEQWHLYSETIPAGTKYICWKDNSYRQIGLSIDDVVIGTIGNWQTVTVPGNAAEANATLTGLMPGGIQYEAFVYPDCNPDKVSETVLFRTIDDCPRPDNLTVGTVGTTTADLNWTGNPEVESYTVKYKRLRNIAFSEGFEDGIGDWTRRNCIYASDVFYFYGAHSGIAGFQFYYNTNPPQYLISPELTGVGKGMRLEFYYQNERIFPETFQVGFSATDNATESFTFGDTITASDGQWHFYSETIPAGTKYICWKHISNGQHSLSIDDIVVGSEIPDGDWQTATVAGNSTDVSTTLTGLMPGTNYKAYVYPECNPIKVSETMCFTTTEVCQTPTNFSVGYVSPTTAELSWSASHYMDSYTVKYKIRGNVFTEGFENGLGDWTIAQEWSFTGVATDAAYTGDYGFRFEYNHNRPQYLFSPELTGITEGMKLEFYYKNWGEGVPETFQVGFSSTDNATESFTFGDEITVSDAQWHLYSASIPAGTKYICFKYLTTGDWFLYLDDIAVGVDSQWQTVTVEGNTDEVSTTLTGLMPATSYEVYVYPDCDPELVSETLLFNTIEDCPRPENLTASYVGATTANLSWTGVPEEESYTMEYREASTVFSEGFENGIGNWTLRDCGNNTGIMTFDGGIAYFRFNHSYFAQYLISPELSGISDGMKLEFEYYIPGNSTYSETFQIGLSSTDNATESFTFGDEITVSSGQYFTYSEPIPVGTKFICWKYTSNMQALNIDNIVVGLDTPAGPWQTATVAGGTVEVSATLTGLSPETSYEVHVYPDCNPDKVSEPVYFTTLEQTTVTQTIALQTGWNWVSIYVDIALNDLRAALVEALPGTVITIKQQNGTTSYDPARHRWTGNITWDLSQMYEIKITASCEITLEGARISPSEHTVTIKSGNNWMAFPFDTSMSVTNAFAGFAVNGDMIKSKDGTTTYTRGRWVGTSLTTLEPGKGYVYKSAVSSDRTFSFPTGSK